LIVTAKGNAPVIRDESRTEREIERRDYHFQERCCEFFDRNIALSTSVDVSRTHSELTNGVLTAAVPKVEIANPKDIKVKAADDEPDVEKKLAGRTIMPKKVIAWKTKAEKADKNIEPILGECVKHRIQARIGSKHSDPAFFTVASGVGLSLLIEGQWIRVKEVQEFFDYPRRSSPDDVPPVIIEVDRMRILTNSL
jgi:hypothetical protein